MQRLGEGLRSFKDFIISKPHEVGEEVYLESLSPVDRQNIRELSQSIEEGMERISKGIDVGMIIFGSSIRPAKLRYHEVGDIDIRLISSAEPYSSSQQETIESLVDIIADFADYKKKQGATSSFKHWTEHSMVVELTSTSLETGKTETKVGPYFLDYDNNDPSFLIIPTQEGSHPLHVSVNGYGPENLPIHLQEERRQKQYFSLLQTFSGRKTS